MRLVLIPLLSCLIGTPAWAQWKYPAPKTVDAKDTYFGKTYRDPYRWLEDLKDKEVEGWFKAEADLTDGLLAKIPGRDALAKEWMDLDKLTPAKYADFAFEHGRVFYRKTLGGENVGKLFMREGWAGKEKLLFGTDYPINNPAVYLHGALFEDLADAERAALFHGNFRRLCGLAGEE